MLLRERDRLAEISFPKGLARLLLIQDDPPRHAVMRRLVNKAFTARRIAQLEPWIRENPGS